MKDLDASLKKHFDFDAFRPGQKHVVQGVLEGRSVVAVMPTGSGKSLCYQLPAVELGGVTLVVSPLISLMKDQVDALNAKGIVAASINSTQDAATQRDVLARAERGEIQLLYVAPERFRFGGAMAVLQRLPISLFVVDEAHCISKWGHDFRPDYLALGDAVRTLGVKQVAAFTATATPQVRQDIIDNLGMADPLITVAGFMRENLHLSVIPISKMTQKMDHLVTLIRQVDATVLVYCATRRHCDEVALGLTRHRINARSYHAGLDDSTRKEVQEAFMSGEVPVIVATNAFGMGIDKRDVRAVAHYDLPGSIEAYYQEVGRAGRDGQPSQCILLFTYADTRIHEFFIDRSLEELPPDRRAERGQEERRKLKTMVRYAYEEGCRHGAILRYFGEQFTVGPEGCGSCDRCTGDSGIVGYDATQTPTQSPSRPRSRRSRAPNLPARELGEQEAVVVQKVLSAVARSRGRLGIADLARVLRGSTRPEIISDGLASTKSYGILSGLTHTQLTSLLRALEDAGCVSGRRPNLTPLGVDVMWRRAETLLRMPSFEPRGSRKAKGAQTKPSGPLTGVQKLRLQAFKEARKSAAKEKGVPPYRIATNRVLEAVALDPPAPNREAWLAISGVGEVSVDGLRELFEPILENLEDTQAVSHHVV